MNGSEHSQAYEDPPVDGLRLVSVIEAVCSRPRMFTPSGTPKEVAAFLEGYFTALREPAGVDTPERCREFCEWLKRQLGGDEREPWFKVWPSSDDEREIARLAELHKEFEAYERSNGASQ